jgi:hypothetical protein
MRFSLAEIFFWRSAEPFVPRVGATARLVSGRLAERFLPAAVVKKDEPGTTIKKTEANNAILSVRDIEVICGSTFLEILFVNWLAKVLGKAGSESWGRSNQHEEDSRCILYCGWHDRDVLPCRAAKGTLRAG